MTHLATESDNPLKRLTCEAYLNSRREYWRKEAANDSSYTRTIPVNPQKRRLMNQMFFQTY